MSAKLIKGTEVREAILEEVSAEVTQIKEKHGIVPGLVTILVGENPASISYVTLKIKTANRLGFKEIQDSQSEDISEEYLKYTKKRLQNYENEIPLANEELIKHKVMKTFKERKINGEFVGRHRNGAAIKKKQEVVPLSTFCV